MQLDKEAMKSAKIALNQAQYLSECGGNAGIRKIYRDKADWLSVLIYFAEIGMRKEDEKRRGAFIVGRGKQVAVSFINSTKMDTKSVNLV